MAEEQEIWQATAWHKGLSLTERLAAQDTPTRSAPPDLTDKARSRLSAWKTQKPFNQDSLFAERLAFDSLSERDLLTLLAEPPEALKARIPAEPGWLAALRRAFTDTAPGDELLHLLEDVDRGHPLSGWLPAFSPLFRLALDSIQETIKTLQERYAHLPFDPTLIPTMFLANISSNILFQVSKPFILEMHIARLRGNLEGETPQARFEHFSRKLRRRGFIESLLAKYPVLARQVVTTIDQWADYLCEFLTHLCADWEAIRTAFSVDSDPGLLIGVDAGKGDRHRSGRSVLLLHFDSGMRLLYKPKPLAVDLHFQNLLSWLNDRGAQPRLRPLMIIDRGHYGWCEFVAPSSCTTEEEVARFYERQGSYLALLYALHATDLHNENLIAAGEHPVLVDLEALFHPQVHAGDPILAGNLAAAALDQSVWQAGILPRRIWSDEHSPGVDTSGLGGQAGQRNPHPVMTWDAPGTDEMRLGRQHVELPASENRPRLCGHDVDPLNYTDVIVSGFTGMYTLLCQHRGALLTEQVPRFAGDEIRVVVRSTNVYGLLWYESFHPDVLRDALDRDRLFDRLWDQVAQRPHLVRVIRSELHDLSRGDIPVFTTTPDSRTIFDSETEPVVDFLDTPSLELTRHRIAQLGEDDLVKQAWVIEASLATLLMDREDTIARPAKPVSPSHPVGQEQLLALANDTGKRLDELALQNASGAYWLGVGPLDESTWGLYPSGADLYAGTAGMALFLAYLGAITGEPCHTALASRALMSVRAQVRAWLEPTIGAFEGLGSAVYLLTNLGVLWADPALLDEAEDLVERLPPLIERDEHLDVIYGSAGCILCLLSLYAVHPSPRTVDVAIQCGDHLLATARPMPQGVAWTTLAGQPPLGGFSHGTAGIAFSLLRLAALSGSERFRHCAGEALTYDRSLFIPELNNWADLRVFPSRESNPGNAGEADAEPAHKSMVAWCHGAPGIGLARVAALDQLDDATIRNEVENALAATTGFGFAVNHSLCHGILGNVEFLLTAARTLRRPQDDEALRRATALIVASIEANGPVTGVPLGVETPGFMTGLAGIGYELLRLAEPDKVPSALLLAPPSWGR